MPDPLKILVTPPSGHPEIFRQAEKETGIAVQAIVQPTEQVLYTVLHHPESYDLVQLEYWMVPEVLERDLIQPIGARELHQFDRILPLFTAGTVNGETTSLRGTAPHTVQFTETAPGGAWLNLAPSICNCDTLGWRSDLAARGVDSWGDLLDPAFTGRVSLADIPAVAIVEAALACEARGLLHYRNIGDLIPEEIDATMDVLHAAADRGQFFSLWSSYEESVADMKSGAVALQSLWPPAFTALRAEGLPVRYRPLREGSRGWAGGLALAAHLRGPSRSRALAYVNWYQAGWPGAFLTRQGYYSAVPETARRYLSAAEWGYWLEGHAAAGDIFSPRGQLIDIMGRVREGGSFTNRMRRIACWSSAMSHGIHLRHRWGAFSDRFLGKRGPRVGQIA